MFHRLLSLTRTFPELVIDCIYSRETQSTIKMFSRTCCRYLCEETKRVHSSRVLREFFGSLEQGFNYSTHTYERNVNFRILICTFSSQNLCHDPPWSLNLVFLDIPTDIAASMNIGRFYSINRPARQSTTIRLQRAPFQSQMSTVTGGKTQPEGRKRGKKKGRERDERLARGDDFARESRHEPRGNWTRQMSHIRAGSIKCRRGGTRATRGTRHGGASLLKLNWTVKRSRAEKIALERNETKLRNSPQAAHAGNPVYPVVPPRIDATRIDFFVTQPHTGGEGRKKVATSVSSGSGTFLHRARHEPTSSLPRDSRVATRPSRMDF